MALFNFTKNILLDKPINVFNYGDHKRDFTYIDDITEVLSIVINKPAKPNIHWDSINQIHHQVLHLIGFIILAIINQ